MNRKCPWCGKPMRKGVDINLDIPGARNKHVEIHNRCLMQFNDAYKIVSLRRQLDKLDGIIEMLEKCKNK